MIYTVITAVLFLAVTAAGVIFLVLRYIPLRRGGIGISIGKKVHPAISLVMTVAGLLSLILIPSSFHTVEIGNVALVKQMGVITDVEESGIYFDFWLVRNYETYDIKVQQVEIETDAYTADAQSMDIFMVLQFQIDPTKVKEIAITYGSLDALTNRIQSVAEERTKATLSQYQAEKLIEERDKVSPRVQQVVNEEMLKKEYCVTFNSAVITDITFSDAFEAAVEAKMMAQQEKLQAQYENEKKKEQADTALYVAEQEAKALVAKAQAQANANVAVAEAEARSIMLKSVEIARMLGYVVTETEKQSLDDEGNTVTEKSYEITYDETHTGADIAEYMKYIEYLSAWDGKLPQVVAGENGFMITVPSVNNPEEKV